MTPQVDCGRYAVKRTVGERVDVTARIFRDGHEMLGAAVRYKRARLRRAGSRRRSSRSATTTGPARSRSTGRGTWCYRVEAWVDRVASFQEELRRKVEAGQKDLTGELSEGAVLLGARS